MTDTQPAIEKLVLAHGWRGIEHLAPYLPVDYAARAARALYRSRSVLITTGFYVEGHAETDGPPGALFLGRALARQGTQVGYVGEPYVLELLEAMADKLWQRPQGENEPLPAPAFIEFPVTDADSSRAAAEQIVSTYRPGTVLAIERCGRTSAGFYRNVRRTDISRWTAQVDELFTYPGITTVGIGDGGNEIGMGLLAQYTRGELGLADPVATKVDHLVLATVSNWGAYGIIAYLGQMSGADLLPAEGEETAALEIMVANGAIDGLTHQAATTVYGFPGETTSAVLAELRSLQVETAYERDS